VTRLFEPPLAIAVAVGPGGEPERITDGPLAGRLRAHSRWVVDVDWWLRPVSRECWRVELGGQVLMEIYRDLGGEGWYLERVYD
jgi:hypothetical protein